jgi:antitoxin component YwqK of YwqJK toxin-antitoxin module
MKTITMKNRSLFILLPFFLCFACQSGTNNREDFSKREIEGKRVPLETINSLTYEKNTNILADGTYIREMDNSMWVEHYKKGLSDGKHLYYEGNRIVSFETFRNGLRHGELTKFWDNGKPLLSHFYSDDLIDSTHYYFKSGKIKERIIFNEYAKRIQWLVYNENGDIIEVKE